MLQIDSVLLEKLRDNYPDFSIKLAYLLYENSIEKISGKKYKELILEHGREYVS